MFRATILIFGAFSRRTPCHITDIHSSHAYTILIQLDHSRPRLIMLPCSTEAKELSTAESERVAADAMFVDRYAPAAVLSSPVLRP